VKLLQRIPLTPLGWMCLAYLLILGSLGCAITTAKARMDADMEAYYESRGFE